MKMNSFGRSTAVLVAALGLLGLGAGIASAATPTPQLPLAAHAAGRVALGKTSIGIWLYNNSEDSLELQSVSGDNAGVPTAGSVLSPGVGHQDFEVVFRAAKTTTVTATYQVQDQTGSDVGTAVVKLWNNAVGMTGVESTFSSATGGSLPLKTAYIDNTGNYEIEASTAVTHTLDASDPQASTLVQQYCDNTNNSAVCTFKPTSHTPSTQEKLLVSGYTPPPAARRAQSRSAAGTTTKSVPPSVVESPRR